MASVLQQSRFEEYRRVEVKWVTWSLIQQDFVGNSVRTLTFILTCVLAFEIT